MLDGATLLDHGAAPWAAPFDPGPEAALLFPADPGAPAAPAGWRPRALVVLDGTWPQASRMAHRVPGLDALPRWSVDRPARAVERLRQPHAAWARSTLEAIAEALGEIEGDPDLERALTELHDRWVARTLWQRGRRPVSGEGPPTP